MRSVGEVGLDRADGQEEARGDLLVGQALDDEHRDLGLAAGQPVGPSAVTAAMSEFAPWMYAGAALFAYGFGERPLGAAALEDLGCGAEVGTAPGAIAGLGDRGAGDRDKPGGWEPLFTHR